VTDHFKTICKCGIVVMQCKCPANDKVVDVIAKCEHNWSGALKHELSEEYNIPSNATGNVVEVELPSTRHWLEIALTNVYGFVISLAIGDETGGVLVEKDLYSCVKREQLAETIASIYNSY
jgi:hypothetical protein